jgi:transcriptional regulator with XRE-family HTH domain
MNFDSKKLITVMKRKRQADGLSIRALSAMIGVSFSSLARIERGDGEPDNNSAIRIIEWLGQDGVDEGLTLDQVAYVHFRADKNIQSKTVHCLLSAANSIKRQYDLAFHYDGDAEDSVSLVLSKQEMEEMAEQFREDLGVADDEPFDSLRVKIDGVDVFVPSDISDLDTDCLAYLTGDGSDQWSAMSVPLDLDADRWAVLRNDQHLHVRQKVTYLEECWHIMLGHKLTKIAKISDAFGRTYDSTEEHDAYYLAAASLLPKAAVSKCVEQGESSEIIASKFDVSQPLVEYRIKRLGLWKTFRGLSVTMD